MIKNKSLPIVLAIILFFSCGGGHGTFHYEEFSIYETNIQNNSLRLVKKFGVNKSGPQLIRYFNNSKKIIYSGTRSFVIIDESGKEEIINLDSIYINDHFFSVSPDDKYVLFGGKIIINSVDSKDEGLYLYDIEQKGLRLIVRDSQVQYPVFSNSGNLISYKVRFRPNSNTALNICDINGENIQKVSSNDFDPGYFSHFTGDDKSIVFVESGYVQSYKIATQATETLIENINFGNISSFPNQVINIYKSNLYYFSIEDNPSLDWLKWEISSFDIDTKENMILSTGISPMAITEDYLLIRESRHSYWEPSLLKLIDINGNLVFELEIGYSGDISFDNSSVVYIHSKKWEEQF